MKSKGLLCSIWRPNILRKRKRFSISFLRPDKEHSRLIREKFFITTPGERELNRRLEMERMKTHGTHVFLHIHYRDLNPFGLGHAVDRPLLLSFYWLAGWTLI